jgi:hypothetical protein
VHVNPGEVELEEVVMMMWRGGELLDLRDSLPPAGSSCACVMQPQWHQQDCQADLAKASITIGKRP